MGEFGRHKNPPERRSVMSVKGMVYLFLIALLVGAIQGPGTALAVTVGQLAPDFTLPSTMGKKVSLSHFRGKKLVLLEFYGADFSPV